MFPLLVPVLRRVRVYAHGRISAAVTMNVKDVYRKQEALWVRLHEKGRKHHEMPCQHNLKEWLEEYIEAAGLAKDPNGPLFRTADPKTKQLGANRVDRQRASAMVKRRAKAGIDTSGICNHTFHGTGITAYLENPEAKLEHAQQLAAHSDPKTTRLYDRRSEQVSLEEVERIGIRSPRPGLADNIFHCITPGEVPPNRPCGLAIVSRPVAGSVPVETDIGRGNSGR